MRGPITESERESISKLVHDYVSDPSPEAHLDLGASMMSITAAYQAFKELCQNTPVAGGPVQAPQPGNAAKNSVGAPLGAAGAKSGSSGSNMAGSSAAAELPPNKGVQALQEENTKLRLQVQQRDNELSILVSMLKKREAVIQAAANTAAVPENSSSDTVMQPQPAGGESSGASGGVDASDAATGARSSDNSNDKGDSGTLGQQAVLFDLNSLADRNRAFELFRKSYRRNEAIESSKMVRPSSEFLVQIPCSAVAWLFSCTRRTYSHAFEYAGAERALCSSQSTCCGSQ